VEELPRTPDPGQGDSEAPDPKDPGAVDAAQVRRHMIKFSRFVKGAGHVDGISRYRKGGTEQRGELLPASSSRRFEMDSSPCQFPADGKMENLVASEWMEICNRHSPGNQCVLVELVSKTLRSPR